MRVCMLVRLLPVVCSLIVVRGPSVRWFMLGDRSL